MCECETQQLAGSFFCMFLSQIWHNVLPWSDSSLLACGSCSSISQIIQAHCVEIPSHFAHMLRRNVTYAQCHLLLCSYMASLIQVYFLLSAAFAYALVYNICFWSKVQALAATWQGIIRGLQQSANSFSISHFAAVSIHTYIHMCMCYNATDL